MGKCLQRCDQPRVRYFPRDVLARDVLRISETSLLDARTFRAEDGVEKLRTALGGLDRSRVRILHLELGGQRIYVKPAVAPMPKIVMPLAWAYSHPDNPLFPANLRFSSAEVEAH